MRKRAFLSLLLLCSLWLLLPAQEAVFSFDPLRPNERLAYRMGDIKGWLLELYAQDIRSLYVTRLINSWDNSTQRGTLQFANNRRDCFFTVMDKREPIILSIYRLKGDEGVVVRLFDKRPYSIFKTSLDGKFILFDGFNDGSIRDVHEKEGIFSLFDGETGALIHQFSWVINNPIGGFDILRNVDGTFSVIYTGQGSVVYGEAIVDPIAMKLRVLWDKTDDIDFVPPEQIEGQFIDDISFKHLDRTLNLEIVVFAPEYEQNNAVITPPSQDDIVDESLTAWNPEEQGAILTQNHKSRLPLIWLALGGGGVFLVAVVVARRTKQSANHD